MCKIRNYNWFDATYDAWRCSNCTKTANSIRQCLRCNFIVCSYCIGSCHETIIRNGTCEVCDEAEKEGVEIDSYYEINYCGNCGDEFAYDATYDQERNISLCNNCAASR